MTSNLKKNISESCDAWLQWSLSYRCNFDCTYCYFSSKTRMTAELLKINIPSLIKTLNKTKKIFRISFTGGEPFLVPNLVEACTKITKKHQISIDTNLSCNKIKEFAEKINPEKVDYINASCHIKELEKNNLLNQWIKNFLLLKEKGIRILALAVAYPPFLNEVQKYRDFFKEKGIELTFIPFMGQYKGREYPEFYTKKEIKVFKLDKKRINYRNQYKKTCNVGYNVGVVYPEGSIHPCYSINESLGNIYKKIEFKKKLRTCPVRPCVCAFKEYDQPLFCKALRENKTFSFSNKSR